MTRRTFIKLCAIGFCAGLIDGFEDKEDDDGG